MAKEDKKEEGAKPVDAASSPRQDDGTASVRQQEGAKPVDAASSPRQDADGTSSNGRGGDAASTEPPKPADAAGSAPAPSSEPDWKDLYARLRADFDNFKKRTARDREDTYRYAESDILKDILPTVDNLALALANATVDAASSPRQQKDGSSSHERGGDAASTGIERGGDAASTGIERGGDAASTAFVKGVQLVYDTLLKSLKDHGAEPFDCVGKDLDTETMEAIATLPSATVAEGKVSNEVKRGWMLKGKVLRVAQVVVSSGKGQ